MGELWKVKNYGVLADRACWSLFAVTTFIVALRIICRLHLVRGGGGGRMNALGLDDLITVGCVLILLLTCILVTLGTAAGLGQHTVDLDPAMVAPALKYNVIISAVLIWSFSMPKFAIIAILKRILSYGKKTDALFWGLALSSQACILATSVWWFKQCDPVAYGWDKSIVGGKCAPIATLADLGYFTSAYSAFLDIFFALYPIPHIMRLNMPLRSRIAVSIALGLSALACIVSIYKLAIFGQVFEILPLDPTYPVPYLDILGVSEGAILLICASLPTLGPLFRFARGSLSSSDRSGSHNVSHNIGSQVGTAKGRRESWGRLKGSRLEDVEQGSGGSVDDIPLVPSVAVTKR